MNVDRQHKLVRRYHVSDAALHDSQGVDHLLMQGNTGSGVWAGRQGCANGSSNLGNAYRSEETEAKLRARKLKSHIHRKGKRGKPLTEQAKESNRAKSSVCVRVEHVFGAQTNDMGGTLVRTIGMVRAKAKIGMKNLAYNEEDQELIRGINSPTNAPSRPVAARTRARRDFGARKSGREVGKETLQRRDAANLGARHGESADITRVKRLSAPRASRNGQKSRCPIDAARSDPASPPAFDGVIHSDDHRSLRHKAIDDHDQQAACHRAGIPAGTVEELMVAREIVCRGRTRSSAGRR